MSPASLGAAPVVSDASTGPVWPSPGHPTNGTGCGGGPKAFVATGPNAKARPPIPASTVQVRHPLASLNTTASVVENSTRNPGRNRWLASTGVPWLGVVIGESLIQPRTPTA